MLEVKMNIKKIVMSGVLVLGISHCHVQAGATPEQFIELVSVEDAYIRSNKVDRKSTFSFKVEPVYHVGKLRINQIKNPCLFVDKIDWENDGGVKINSNEIELVDRFDGLKRTSKTKYVGAYFRPDLGHNLIFSSSGVITNKLDGREVIQVLGTDRNCYLKPTIEEWGLYANKYSHVTGDYILKDRVKFYLK